MTTAFSYEQLHPKARGNFRRLSERLLLAHEGGYCRSLFLPYEGFRSVERQLILYNQRPRVTKAGPWQSAHNYGLAVDYVPRVEGKWVWDENADWATLKQIAIECGLSAPIAWDRPHIEHPIWAAVSRHLV